MPYTSALDSAAARSAISRGDDLALERYLREGGNNPVQTLTATTGNLIAGTNLINVATGGFNYLLPAATGTQNHVRVVIQTAIASGTCIIRTKTNADFFVGMMTYATTTFAAGSTHALGGTDALLTITAAAGGVKGSTITFIDIAPNLWLVQGTLSSTTGADIATAWA